MPGRPRRSCDSCNAQKLRCCGQKPTCQRCTRIGRSCNYTGSSATPTRARQRTASVVSLTPARTPLSAPLTSPSLLHNIPAKRYSGIPSALLPTLIDLYFSHVYNANLMVHRPSFLESLQTDDVRLDFVLSICALAAMFYKDANGYPSLVDNHFCREWAEEAGRIALTQIEKPSYENTAVFLNLALFWYSYGEFHRAVMHSGFASTTTWTLGLPDIGHENEHSLKLEIRRRRFWACYLLNSFLTDSLFPKVPTVAMMNMPLPCCENDFGLGKPQGGVSLKSGQSTQSIYAEVVRVMALWSAVVALVKQPETSLTTRLAEIQVLDGRIHDAYSKLSECFQLTSNKMSSTHLDDLPNLLLLHVMYQQCWCSLHSSIVPLFSWSVFDDNYSYAQQLSAQTAFEHANTVSSLLDTALKLNWDATRMPSFIGYAAYCACAIQTPFLWCLRSEVKQHAVRSVLANLKTLQVLGSHWKFLKVLGKYACHLYKVHASRPFPLADEPKNMTGAALKGIQPNARARLSILAHNTILVNEEGSFARIPEDIGDLSLNEAGSHNAALDNEENIAGFMSHISGEGRTVTNQLPVMMDPFLPSENLDYYDLSGAFHQPTGAQDMDSFGNIEDWISELLQHEA